MALNQALRMEQLSTINLRLVLALPMVLPSMAVVLPAQEILVICLGMLLRQNLLDIRLRIVLLLIIVFLRMPQLQIHIIVSLNLKLVVGQQQNLSKQMPILQMRMATQFIALGIPTQFPLPMNLAIITYCLLVRSALAAINLMPLLSIVLTYKLVRLQKALTGQYLCGSPHLRIGTR